MVGVGSMGMLFGFYFMKFSTDVLLIAPVVMGLLVGVFGRIWDAISDPIAGYLSDRSSAKQGRRRAWMYASALPIFVATVMLWAPPTIVSGAMLAVWMAFALIVYETANTAFLVPYGALGMELTSTYHERTRLFGYRHVIAAVGSGVGLGCVYLLRTSDDPRATALFLSLIGGFLTAGIILFSTNRLVERAGFQGRGAGSVRAAFTDVFRNPHGRLILLVYAIETFGTASLSILAPYVMQYVIKAPQYTELFVGFYFVPQFAFTPMWVWVARRVGKKAIWLFSMTVQTIAFLMMFFIFEGGYVMIFAIVFLLGLGGGAGAVVAPSIQADVIDYDEYLTGERKEGAYVAIWNLVRKGAAGVSVMATGVVLQMVGYEPNAEQSEATKTAMIALISLLPAAGYGVGAILFARFRLNEREHRAIVLELEARRGVLDPQK